MASIVRNVAHTCMTEQHCNFLHAAHEQAAKEIEAYADELDQRARVADASQQPASATYREDVGCSRRRILIGDECSGIHLPVLPPWSSGPARSAHNREVAGSSPAGGNCGVVYC